MKKKSITVAILTIMLAASTILNGCSGNGTDTQKKTETSVEQTDQKDTDQKEKEEKEEQKEAELADGVYKADFVTDNGMFQVNEAYDGKGTLTVKDGEMTIHVSLRSKKIVNLYVGLAKNAKNDKKNLLEPTTDTVTYSDGTTEEVYGFDVPVKALDQEFDLALIGTKGKWYDHKVYVTNPTPVEEEGWQHPQFLMDAPAMEQIPRKKQKHLWNRQIRKTQIKKRKKKKKSRKKRSLPTVYTKRTLLRTMACFRSMRHMTEREL